MRQSSLAEFDARVSFSGLTSEGPWRSRVRLRPERLVLAGADDGWQIPLARVFDIAQDVSPLAGAESSETVTIAFTADGCREMVSVEGRAETLFRFQHALFGTLLDGTPVAIRHTEGGTRQFERSDLALRVCATRLRVDDDAGDPVLTVPRDDLTRFRTQRGEGDSPSALSLYWRRDGRPAMTTARFPSPRLFNLFGRYIQSPLRMAPSDADEAGDGSIEVLLVDDEPDALELAAVFLRNQSDRLSLTTTECPGDALERLERSSFDCVVSDFRMPNIDGIELLQRVRESNPDLPFILFTGQGSEEVAKRAILDNVTDYVEKGAGTDPYEVLIDRIIRAVR